MGWQRSGTGTMYYASRRMSNNRTRTKYGGRGKEGELLQLADHRDRLQRKLQRLEWDFEEAVAKYNEQLILIKSKVQLLAKGAILRNRKWLLVDDLRKPLTEEERTMIERAKQCMANNHFEELERPRLKALDIANQRAESRAAYEASCKKFESALSEMIFKQDYLFMKVSIPPQEFMPDVPIHQILQVAHS